MTECMRSRQHQYIFEPVCASVLLRRNAAKEALRSRHSARIEGQVQLEPMALRLSQVGPPTPPFILSLSHRVSVGFSLTGFTVNENPEHRQ